MKRHLPGCAALMALAATAPAQQPSPFKTQVQLVEVDASVVDRSGRSVTNLQKDDFEVREDGHPMDVVIFAAVASDTAGATPRAATSPRSRATGRCPPTLPRSTPG